MKKRIMAILCVMLLVVSMVSGCGSYGSEQKPTAEPAAEDPASEDSASEDPVAAEDGAEQAETASSGEAVKIGALYPITGDVAAIGQNIMRGVTLAVDQINAAGGINGRPIEIVQGDSMGDAKSGMTEAERLITQENVVALLGAYQSSVTEVVAQVAEQYQVPLITAISTADTLTESGYEYFFRMAPTNSMFLRDMIQFLSDTTESNPDVDIKTIAVCADNTLLGQETSEWAQYWAKENGIEFLGEVLYSKGAADLSSEVIQLKELNPDALVVDNYISDGILLTKTMAEQGYKPNLMIGKATAYIDPSFIPAVGGLGNGIVTAAEFNPGTKGKEISDAFEQEFGVPMNGHSAEAYTAVWVLKTAIEQAAEIEREAIKDALVSIKIEKSFPGGSEIILPYDVIAFTNPEMNERQHTQTNADCKLTILQIQDGDYKTVWPTDVSDTELQYPASFQ